jgi:hypothetical protein
VHEVKLKARGPSKKHGTVARTRCAGFDAAAIAHAARPKGRVYRICALKFLSTAEVAQGKLSRYRTYKPDHHRERDVYFEDEGFAFGFGARDRALNPFNTGGIFLIREQREL